MRFKTIKGKAIKLEEQKKNKRGEEKEFLCHTCSVFPEIIKTIDMLHIITNIYIYIYLGKKKHIGKTLS